MWCLQGKTSTARGVKLALLSYRERDSKFYGALPSWSILLYVDQKDSVVILILEASSTMTVRLSLIDLRLTR